MIITHPLSTHPLEVDISSSSALLALFPRSAIIMIITQLLQLHLVSLKFPVSSSSSFQSVDFLISRSFSQRSHTVYSLRVLPHDDSITDFWF
jgi:hypothetical protein